MGFEIVQASSAQQLEQARALFQEYASSLDFNLCFQSFEEELAGLPGSYAAPEGRLLIAYASGTPEAAAGCVALHPIGEKLEGICEMKRLYVRPEFRGSGLGAMLANAVIAAAREIGYRRMRLDTIPQSMASAVRMYRGLGFREIAPYTVNPVPGAIFLELQL